MVKLMERHRIIKCQCLQTPIRTRCFQEVCIFTSLTIGFHYDSPVYTLILLMHLDASRCMILHVRATRIAFLIESITWSAIVCGGGICYCGSRVFNQLAKSCVTDDTPRPYVLNYETSYTPSYPLSSLQL